MSKENLEAFAKAVRNSGELRNQLSAILTESARSTAEQIARLSASAGTPFTAEEYVQSLEESSAEISAEQLDAVAGGAWDPLLASPDTRSDHSTGTPSGAYQEEDGKRAGPLLGHL